MRRRRGVSVRGGGAKLRGVAGACPGTTGFGRRWIVAKVSGDGLGFTDTKYFGQGCADVSLEEVEIGWMLTPAFSGQGCATEAARAVRGEAFERLRLESIVAVHHPANASSGRIMEKLGMGSSATSSPATCGRLAFIA